MKDKPLLNRSISFAPLCLFVKVSQIFDSFHGSLFNIVGFISF